MYTVSKYTGDEDRVEKNERENDNTCNMHQIIYPYI